MSQKIFIKTFGCQMNEYDSNRIYDIVKKIGYYKTEKYEEARMKVAQFINANSTDEVIFTRGATEGINLIASCLSSKILKEGDEIITGPYNVVSKTLKSGDKVQQKKVEAKKEEENE